MKNNPIADFTHAMQSVGLILDKHGVIDDGKIHPCRCAHDSANKKSGRYYLHSDGIANGAFGCYHESENALANEWRSTAPTPSMSDTERKAYSERMARQQAEREAQTLQEQKDAQQACIELWGRGHDATSTHQYIERKGIRAYGVKELNGALLVPMYDGKDNLCNIQFIQADGTKRFKTGAKKKGAYFDFGATDTKAVVICEGFATGASIAQATGHTVVVAFDAGNLLPVAQRIKSNLPDGRRLIIAGDNDAFKPTNTGKDKATACAVAVGADVVIPDFTGCEITHAPTDFNDLHALAGLEAVKSQIDGAQVQSDDVIEAVQAQTVQNAPQPEYGRSVSLVCATDITPEPILWAWRNWLPLGKLTVLAGAGGTGKTTLAIAIATAITKGARMPDKSPCEAHGNVLMWSSEDDPADTLIPRFIASGADLSKVHIINGAVNNMNGEVSAFDPARDIPLLELAVAKIGGATLLIIDPIVQAVAGDANKANEVRRSLQSIVDFAMKNDVAVIGITHFTKGSKGTSPTERVLGSGAFTALARMVWVTSKSEDNKRVLARSKSNIAPDDGGFEYDIETLEIENGITTSRVLWGAYIEGSAREILNDVETFETDSEAPESEQFLIKLLGNDELLVDDIKAQCLGAGVSFNTIRKAGLRLGVVKNKTPHFQGKWTWKMPTARSDILPPHSDTAHFEISLCTHRQNPHKQGLTEICHSDIENNKYHYGRNRINRASTSKNEGENVHSDTETGEQYHYGENSPLSDGFLKAHAPLSDGKIDPDFGEFVNNFAPETDSAEMVNLTFGGDE